MKKRDKKGWDVFPKISQQILILRLTDILKTKIFLSNVLQFFPVLLITPPPPDHDHGVACPSLACFVSMTLARAHEGLQVQPPGWSPLLWLCDWPLPSITAVAAAAAQGPVRAECGARAQERVCPGKWRSDGTFVFVRLTVPMFENRKSDR